MSNSAEMNRLIRDRVSLRGVERDSAVMNRLLTADASRGQVSTRGVARLSGVPDPQARLRAAYADLERAEQLGDELMQDYCERVLDDALAEWRTARSEQPRDPETGQFVSFDGGFHGRRPVAPGPDYHDETANSLLKRAVAQSAVERAERDADPGHTIIVDF